MTPESIKHLSSTIRALRRRLLDDLRAATEATYRLSIRAREADLLQSPAVVDVLAGEPGTLAAAGRSFLRVIKG